MTTTGLVTVMFTDIVDSTRQRDELGDDVADQLVAVHDEIVRRTVDAVGGRVVKTLGDGALAVFQSSVDAVGAAQVIQEEMARADVTHPFAVRIGIHAGEVVLDGDDVTGLPVSVASRVCGVAGGGQIVVSSVVRTLIGSRGGLGFRSLGPTRLKGVSEPVELWMIGEESQGTAAPVAVRPAFPPFVARGVSAHLVGRAEALEELSRAHDAAKEQSQLVAIVGEPGIGKTALTATWARSAFDAGAVVLGGRSTSEAALPYQPFIEIARSILAVNPGLIEVLGPGSGSVAQLVPGSGRGWTVPPPLQGDPDTVEYLIAEAFAILIDAMSGTLPTVLILDDLHWADSHSIAVLENLARHRDDSKILVIGTYRDTDLVRKHPLPRLVTDLRRERRLVRILPDPLSDVEVAEMVGAGFGGLLDEEVARSIATETRGNPFFVSEMSAHLRDEGAIDDQGHWVSDIPVSEYGIPEGVREVVGRRLDRLGDTAAQLLEAASVVGPAFSVDVVAEVTGIDDDEVDTALEAAVRASLIEQGDSYDEFAFTHALVRQTVYDDLSPRRRVRYHRAVGDALERRNASPRAVLHHWVVANVPDRALAASIAAAEESAAMSAYVESIEDLYLAMDLWEDATDPEGATGMTHPQLVYRISDQSFDFAHGSTRELRALIERELEDRDMDDLVRGLLYTQRSNFEWLEGSVTSSQASIEEALRLIPADPPSRQRAEVLATHANRLLNIQRDEQAIEVATAALAMAREVGAVGSIGRALSALGTSLGNVGQLGESERYFTELTSHGLSSGNIRDRLVVYVNQGETYRLNGHLEKARLQFDEGYAVARELGAKRWDTLLAANASLVDLELGDWDDAARRIATVDITEIGPPELTILAERLALYSARGQVSDAETAADRLEEIDLDDLDPESKSELFAGLIASHRWSARRRAAFDLAAHCLTSLDPTRWHTYSRFAAEAFGAVADIGGDVNDELLGDVERWSDGMASEEPRSWVDASYDAIRRGEHARLVGRDEVGTWTEALGACDEALFTGAIVRWRLAEALIAAGRGAEAGPYIEAAHATAARLGAKPLVRALATLIEG